MDVIVCNLPVSVYSEAIVSLYNSGALSIWIGLKTEMDAQACGIAFDYW